MSIKFTRLAIVHYDEVALKKGNRDFFERVLISNIARALSDCKVKKAWGHIQVLHNEECDTRHMQDVLAKIPGIAYFGIGVKHERVDVEQDIAFLNREVLVCAKSFNQGQWQTFRVTVKRVDKTFPLQSTMLERDLGEVIYEAYDKKRRVDLRNAELEVMVEIHHAYMLVYAKQNGIGGLPVGSSGSAVILLSGGFDSPVAGYMMAKRGVRVHAVHFHGLPHTTEESIEKVRALSRVLARYSGEVSLHLVSVVPAMKAIAIEGKQNKLRLILLRRFMNQVAERIAFQNRAKALITGESVGQVASQTLENMRATAEPVSLPVLRPLCGFNKQEILAIARDIGTHDISVLPHDDTCSMFMPKQPETRARLDEVHEALKTYDEKKLIEDALAEVVVEKIA